MGSQQVHSAGLQPFAGPLGEVSTAGDLEFGEQIVQLGVAPRVLGEVLVKPGEELALAHPCHELSERRGPLRVGDAVEVHPHRVEVDHVRRDRVSGGKLVLPVGPGLAEVGEGGPCLGESSRMHVGVVRRPLGEGLVQPQIVPPLHGDEIAEPHMSHLVQDGVGSLLVGRLGDTRTEDEIFQESDAARVLHGPRVELGDEELVVLSEGIRNLKLFLEEREALLGQFENVISVQVFGQ